MERQCEWSAQERIEKVEGGGRGLVAWFDPPDSWNAFVLMQDSVGWERAEMRQVMLFEPARMWVPVRAVMRFVAPVLVVGRSV